MNLSKNVFLLPLTRRRRESGFVQRRAYAADGVTFRLAQRNSGYNEVGFSPHHALVIAKF